MDFFECGHAGTTTFNCRFPNKTELTAMEQQLIARKPMSLNGTTDLHHLADKIHIASAAARALVAASLLSFSVVSCVDDLKHLFVPPKFWTKLDHQVEKLKLFYCFQHDVFAGLKTMLFFASVFRDFFWQELGCPPRVPGWWARSGSGWSARSGICVYDVRFRWVFVGLSVWKTWEPTSKGQADWQRCFWLVEI